MLISGSGFITNSDGSRLTCSVRLLLYKDTAFRLLLNTDDRYGTSVGAVSRFFLKRSVGLFYDHSLFIVSESENIGTRSHAEAAAYTAALLDRNFH